MEFSELTRRQFLRVSAIAGGGLLVACGGGSSGGGNSDSPNGGGGKPVNAQEYAVGEFLRLSTDNRVHILVGASEIGQGALTSMAMIVAEELDVDWEMVTAEHSPVAARFNNPYFGGLLQFTVASATTRGYFDTQRQIGAAVRQMLIQAAADRWQVARESLRTDRGFVYDDTNGRSASYGELAEDAASYRVPLTPPLKEPAQYRIIGQSKQRNDAAAKVTGALQYGIDVDLPDMLTAVIARPPRFFGQVLTVDDNAALAVPGVREVHSTPAGVAVVADDYWSAEKGRQALEVRWNELLAGRTDSETTRSTYELRLNLPGVPIRIDGLVPVAQLAAAEVRSADYYFPFQAHAAMEPLNVTVDYDGSRADIWTGSQSPTLDKTFAELILGLLPNQINFHTMSSGGGFGRRGNVFADYVRDACFVARAVRRPVKVMWTREDDMKGGFYRPAAAVRVSAAVDNQGNITAWTHRAVTQDVTAILYAEELLDTLAEGALPPLKELTDLETGMPYDIDNVLMDAHLTVNLTMPALWMRSVNKYTDVFAQETFIDEIAARYSRDPYQYRRGMLNGQPRLQAVLDAAAQAANWGSPNGGRSQGMAVLGHWMSYVAQVVELSVSADKVVTIHRVISAVDVGTAINPDLVVAQVESAIVFALTSVFYGEITLDNGVVQQSNYDDYRVLRMFETPEMTTLVLPSNESPGGVGELGVPALGPALVNAIFAATGETLRETPLSKLGYRIAERSRP